MRITVITWKDERYSASNEDLASINKMLRENAKKTKRESKISFWKRIKQWMIRAIKKR